MKFSIMGAGNLGSALAAGLVRRGHEVVFGARDAAKKGSGTDVKMLSVAAAAQFSNVIVLAVP